MTNETKVVEKVNLSELPDETPVSYEDAHYTYTAEELREKVKEDDYKKSVTWYVATEKRWAPDAKWMLSSYIENEYDQMYEDWDERAMDCIKKEHIDRIQAVLEEAFSGDSATLYWSLDGPEIDILS